MYPFQCILVSLQISWMYSNEIIKLFFSCTGLQHNEEALNYLAGVRINYMYYQQCDSIVGNEKTLSKNHWSSRTLGIDLMTLTVKDCVLLNSAQEFIEIEAWLLLTFFIYLHNQ